MRDEICDLYIIDFLGLADTVTKEGYKRILIQAPDGLKPLYRCILNFLMQELKGKVEIYFSSSPTYGGCDVAFDEAIKTSSDAIIHIGHTKYPWLKESAIPVIYIPAFYKWNPGAGEIERMASALMGMKARSIGVLASVQHVLSISLVVEELRARGFETVVPSEEGFFDGQVIGCYYEHAKRVSDKVDAYLVISGGFFHSLGLALVVDKPVLGYDPMKNTIWNANDYARRVLAKRYYTISKLRHSSIRDVCIIMGSKPGQFRPNIARDAAGDALKKGFTTHIVVSERLDFDRMVAIDNALKSDIYVVTSCPRIPIDDLNDFYKPVVTPGEFYMLLHGCERYIYPW